MNTTNLPTTKEKYGLSRDDYNSLIDVLVTEANIRMDMLNKRVELDAEYQKCVADYPNRDFTTAGYITYHQTRIQPIRDQIDNLTLEIEQPSFIGCPGCGQAFMYSLKVAFPSPWNNPHLSLRHRHQTNAEAQTCKLLGFGAKYRETVVLRRSTTITRASFPKYREDLPVD